eukprot:1156729-Pelagomonas_calceolata.AAC.5
MTINGLHEKGQSLNQCQIDAHMALTIKRSRCSAGSQALPYTQESLSALAQSCATPLQRLPHTAPSIHIEHTAS